MTESSTSVYFRLLDFAAQSILGFSCSVFDVLRQVHLPSIIFDHVTFDVGYCFRLIDIAAQMMRFQGSQQAKADIWTRVRIPGASLNW